MRASRIASAASDGVMDTLTRQRALAGLGFSQVLMPYCQPPLVAGVADKLTLLAHGHGPGERVEAAVLLRFLAVLDTAAFATDTAASSRSVPALCSCASSRSCCYS